MVVHKNLDLVSNAHFKDFKKFQFLSFFLTNLSIRTSAQ